MLILLALVYLFIVLVCSNLRAVIRTHAALSCMIEYRCEIKSDLFFIIYTELWIAIFDISITMELNVKIF